MPNIELLMYNSKNCLKTAQAKIESGDYDTALDLLASTYGNVRQLMQLVFDLKREKAEAKESAGEDVT